MLANLVKTIRDFASALNREQFDARLFPHYSLWLAMAMLACICLALWANSAFRLSVGADGPTIVLGFWLFCVGIRYQERHRTTSAIYFILAYLLLIAPLLGVASYLAIGSGFPLIDAQLASFDRMIGFDWLAHASWVNDRPWATGLLTFTYNQLLYGMIATLIFLLVTGRFERIREVMLLMGLTSISSIFFVTFMPAIGAYAFYNPDPQLVSNIPALAGRYHLPDFTSLRDGTMATITIGTTTGLVTFPSFHTITPVMCNWAMRGTWAFWLMMPFTVVMVISTLAIGGHYLADVLAGLAYCALAAWCYAVWQARRQQRQQLEPAMMAGE